jgi:hypothetical protein
MAAMAEVMAVWASITKATTVVRAVTAAVMTLIVALEMTTGALVMA